MTESEKFDTSSKCLTYEFKDDPNGVYLVELTGVFSAVKHLRFLDLQSEPKKAKSRGKLFPDASEPANMIAKFPLSESISNIIKLVIIITNHIEKCRNKVSSTLKY